MTDVEFDKYIISRRDRMYRFAKSILYDTADTEDVVQEVFARLWTRRDELDECENIDAFILTSVRNACLDVLRRAKTRQSKQGDIFQGRDKVSDTTGLIEMNDIKKIAEDIIHSLPEKQRLIMHLRDVEGCEMSEIAEIAGIEETAVRMNLSRARKTVKEKLLIVMNYGTRK